MLSPMFLMIHGSTAVVPEVAVTFTMGTSKSGESISPSAEIHRMIKHFYQ